MPRDYEAPPAKKRGCLFWGCLTVGIVCLIGAVAAVVIVRSFTSKVKRFVASEPAEIRVFEPTAEQAAAVREKWKGFAAAALKGDTASFSFSEDDLNAVVAMEGSPLAELKGKAYFSMAGDRLSAEVSMPLAEMGFPGKYLNGSLGLSIRQADDRVSVYITDVRVNEETLPGPIMKKISGQDLLKNTDNVTVNTDTGPQQINVQEQIARFVDTIQISDGKFHVGLVEHRPFISDQPADVRPYVPSPAEKGAVQAKIALMDAAADAGSGQEFVLSESELNTMLALGQEQDAGNALEGKVRITLNNNNAVADGSFPLTKVGLSGYFFNGRITMMPRMSAGHSRLFVVDIEVENESLPEFILKEARKKDVFAPDGAAKKERTEIDGLFAKATDFDIRDGKLVLRFGSGKGE